MPISLETLTLQQAKTLLAQTKSQGQLDVATNRKFWEGDHWQGGQGWVGPRPPVGHSQYLPTMALIQAAFTTQNAIKEVVRRHAAGVLGQEPDWGLTVRRPLGQVTNDQGELVDEEPNDEEIARIEEASAALTSWWDRVKMQKELRQLVETALWAGRASLRLFVPPGVVGEDGQVPPPATLEDALRLIWPMRPEVGEATVAQDRRSMREVGVYVYRDEESKQEQAEICYVDPATGFTVLRILVGSSEGWLSEVGLPLDGHLLIAELVLEPLITESVRSNQKQLNKAKTMMGRNVDLAGFLERVILNGQMPGHYVADPTAPEGRRFVPAPFQVGAGSTNFISGVEYTDEGGKKRLANPSINYRDPVPVDTFVETEDAAYTSILKETHQLHAKISGDATASGESRKQARTDFENSLDPTATEVNAVGRWLVETVLALASYFMGQPERFADLRANFECRIDAGPLSSEEQNTIITQKEKGLLSRETAMSLLGRQDPEAEAQRIQAERQELDPIQQVQLERARTALQRDQQPAGSDAEQIRQQILAGAGGEQ